MLKKILLLIIAVLAISIAVAAYLFSVNTDRFTADTTAQVAQVEGENVYAIRFVDGEGNPVPGVMANVCDDASCTMLTSEADGETSFSGEIKDWYVQILKVPEGFELPEGEKFPLNEDETVIAINKKP